MYRSKQPFLHHLLEEPSTSLAGGTNNDTDPSTLPGYPDLILEDDRALCGFLLEEVECKQLDMIARHLWMMSTQRSNNISPLHRQEVKGRKITITEEPGLHLVWFYDVIYVKPLPRFLMSKAFWENHLLHPRKPYGDKHEIILLSALGFLRSYAHLVRHESDFRIAQAKFIIPEFVQWQQWRILRGSLLRISDDEVSPRFSFGEIRLTRLNFYCKFLLAKSYYHRTHRQYGDYFASYYPPLLFLFGIVSTLLSSMQLAATVEQIESGWSSSLPLFRIFSFVVMAATFQLLFALMAIFIWKLAKEWVFAMGDRYSPQRRSRPVRP
jgi:hypothetical protein